MAAPLSRISKEQQAKLRELFPGPCHIQQLREAGFFDQSYEILSYHLKGRLMRPVPYMKAIGLFDDGVERTVKEMQEVAKKHSIKLTRYVCHMHWEPKNPYIDDFSLLTLQEFISDTELRQRYGKSAWKTLERDGWRQRQVDGEAIWVNPV